MGGIKMDYQEAIYELATEINALDVWIEQKGNKFKVCYGGGG